MSAALNQPSFVYAFRISAHSCVCVCAYVCVLVLHENIVFITQFVLINFSFISFSQSIVPYLKVKQDSMRIEVMAKQILITILLLMVWINNNNIEAVRETGAAHTTNYNVPKVRQTRAAPATFFSGLIELWNAFVNIQYLYLSVSVLLPMNQRSVRARTMCVLVRRHDSFHKLHWPWRPAFTSGSIRINSQQKNETNSALQQTYDILADGFSDTATKKPQVGVCVCVFMINFHESEDIEMFRLFHWQIIVETAAAEPNGTTTTTTERYRISRKELGYILGRNYRGLKKLFNIEWNDALNVSTWDSIDQIQ